MAGAGVAFSRFLEVSSSTGLWIASAVVFVYAVLGGMKGITYTQVAQYVVLILAYTIPAIFISINLTGNAIPPLGLFSTHTESGVPLLAKLNQIIGDLGFATAHGPDLARSVTAGPKTTRPPARRARVRTTDDESAGVRGGANKNRTCDLHIISVAL